MIYTFGPISGSHLNPAVTLGLWLCKRMKASDVTPYIIAQCVGALLASMTLRGMFADHATLGATLPTGGIWRAFGFEVFLTGLLMLVILNTTNPHHPAKDCAVVGLEALFGGPISGASMNPARSLGPALVSGAIADLWIYWTAPWLGILAAVSMHRLLMFSTTEDRESQVEHTTIEPEHK
jgi:aquaporin Z